jgi:DNA topoisomerase-3
MFPKKLAGKTLSKTNIKMLCEKKKTSKIKGFKSKAGKAFAANLLLDKENKIKFDFPSKK